MLLINRRSFILLSIFILFSIILVGCSSGNMDNVSKYYNLNISADEQKGSIKINPEKSAYVEGDYVEITAIAVDGLLYLY